MVLALNGPIYKGIRQGETLFPRYGTLFIVIPVEKLSPRTKKSSGNDFLRTFASVLAYFRSEALGAQGGT